MMKKSHYLIVAAVLIIAIVGVAILLSPVPLIPSGPLAFLFAESGGIKGTSETNTLFLSEDEPSPPPNITEMWGNNSITVTGHVNDTRVVEGGYGIRAVWNGSIEWDKAVFNIFLVFPVGEYNESAFDYRVCFKAEVSHNTSIHFLFGISVSQLIFPPTAPDWPFEYEGNIVSGIYELNTTWTDSPMFLAVDEEGNIKAELLCWFPLQPNYVTEFYVHYAFIEVIPQP